MRALDVMSSPVYPCSVHDSLNRVAAIMWDRAVGIVPVLDDDGDVVAVITDRDVAMAAFLSNRRLSALPVSESMSRTVHVCRTTDSLRDVQASMAEHRCRRLPVLNEDGQLVGIVSVDDLIRASTSGWQMLGAPELLRALGKVAYVTDHDPAPSTETEGEGLLEGWQGALQQLQTRRDEMRVQLRLASMDASDEWTRLEKQAAGALRDLGDRYRALQSSLARPADADAEE